MGEMKMIAGRLRKTFTKADFEELLKSLSRGVELLELHLTDEEHFSLHGELYPSDGHTHCWAPRPVLLNRQGNEVKLFYSSASESTMKVRWGYWLDHKDSPHEGVTTLDNPHGTRGFKSR